MFDYHISSDFPLLKSIKRFYVVMNENQPFQLLINIWILQLLKVWCIGYPTQLKNPYLYALA